MPDVTSRPLLTILFALMMAFGSIALGNGGAMAAVPGDGAAQASGSGHCDETSDRTAPAMPAGDQCCIAMGAALPPMVGQSDDADLGFERMDDRPVIAGLATVFTAKLPIPPPRLA